jgi:hypothetical protein
MDKINSRLSEMKSKVKTEGVESSWGNANLVKGVVPPNTSIPWKVQAKHSLLIVASTRLAAQVR